MRTLLKVVVLLAATVPAVASAQPREVFHPPADRPAFRCLVPEGWSNRVDASGNLLLANRDHTVNFSLTLVPCSRPGESLDALAKALFESAVHPPWDSREPAEISGYRGFKYTARVRHTNGVEVRAEVLLVAVGDKQIAACSLLLADPLSPADEGAARLVQAAIHIVPVP